MKRLMTVAVLCCMLLGAAAAGQAQEKVVLKYMTWVNAQGAEWIQEDFIEPFQELYPHIEVQHEYVPFAEYWRKLMTMYAAGDAPDLMHMSVGYVYDYADRGLLLNLQPYFDRDLDPDNYYAEPMKAARYPSMETGDLYAMPYAFVMSVLHYNKDMFDAAGVAYPTDDWTWDDLLEAAKALTKDFDGDGKIDQWGLYFKPDYYVLDAMIYAFGGRVLSEDLTQVMLDSDEAEAAVQFLVDLMWKHQVSPSPQIYHGLGNMFETGMAAMAIGNMADLDVYRRIDSFDWDVAMVPGGPARKVVRMWPDSIAISSSSKHPEEAWEYVKFMVNYGKIDRYSGERKVPLYRPLAESDEWLEKDRVPDKTVYIRAIQYGHPLDFRPNWGEWSAAREAELEPAFLGQMPVRDALKNAAQAVQAILDDM
ncbi:MAG: sugar ABC transporter substrate-binding protein [Firmicutes bacterium]|jgi:multiple sugar transport system substrate-binding protein|nr:sugar ABC transporter substrate-binding protein [Bacillota bacterium]